MSNKPVFLEQANGKLVSVDEMGTNYLEVVMWLYEKHGFWIEVVWDIKPNEKLKWYSAIAKVGNFELKVYLSESSDSPTEAYQEAILYTLKNLI